MIVTRVAYSKGLTKRKFSELSELASRLGKLRHELWDKYGSISGYEANHRTIRDKWLAEKRKFDVPARLWKETLRDVIDDIQARKAAGFKAVARKLYRRYGATEGKKFCAGLRDGSWKKNPVMHRYIRKELPRGRTWVKNQIVLDKQCYKYFIHNNKGWIEVTGLQPRKRVAIPLGNTKPISSTIRLILRDNRVEIHHIIEVDALISTKDHEVGVDKGYTEVFVDSDGEHHGKELGVLLTEESDHLKVKYQRRNKLLAIANKKPHKAKNIHKHNLGRRKLNRRKSKHVSKVKTVVHSAAHQVARKASVIVHEDLSISMKSKKQRGKNTNRRLAGWVKGMIQEALEGVSQRYGVPLRSVNPAYTSQVCSSCGSLGERRQGQLYCTNLGCGVVTHDDVNAALNILARSRDTEIHPWMKAVQVKSILLKRSGLSVETVQPEL